MTKLLREVIERVQTWPDDRQDDAARFLLDLEAQQTNAYRLTPEQVKEVEDTQRQLRDGSMKFATDDEMAAFWKQCSL